MAAGPATGGASWGGGGGGVGKPDQLAEAAASVVASLKQGVDRLQLSHQATQANLGRAGGNLTSSLAKIEGFEVDIKKASDKYVFMQKVRGPLRRTQHKGI